MSTFTPKKYQELALTSVEVYFRTCQQMGSADYAFQEITKALWGKKSDFTSLRGFLGQMPHFCRRVSIGGGKTYLAAKSVALVNNRLLYAEPDRLIGALWEKLSNGSCLFVMVKDKQWDWIRAKL